MDGAVVLDVNLGAGLGDDALDRLAAGSDERADLLRIDLDRLDARRVFAESSARGLSSAPRHDRENLGARFFRALDRFGHDLVADAGQFQIELEAGDAVVGAAEFEIHVAEMIFGADDVGQQVRSASIADLRRTR